ncbi:hypothetical protein C8R46DRAFT_1029955 [Mycena filopes]|nr:hypothetical protein C8R46DRAFT_1029955 [Mycena filopes]
MTLVADLAKTFQHIIKTEIREAMEAIFQSFDVEALGARAASVMGKQLGGPLVQIAYGGYNSILAVTFTDGTDVLVRMAGSYHIKKPLSDELATRVFESEVATVKYLAANTSLPIPKIYYANSDPAEAGARLMIIETKLHLVAQWASMQAELSAQKFDAIGCLTSATGTVGPLLPSSIAKYTLRKPHWGPFRSTREFLEGHACSALAATSNTEKQQRFLERLLAAIRALPPAKFHTERLVLTHGDLSSGNVLCGPDFPSSNCNIVGVIDWAGSSVLPVWAAFQEADFLCRMEPVYPIPLPIPRTNSKLNRGNIGCERWNLTAAGKTRPSELATKESLVPIAAHRLACRRIQMPNRPKTVSNCWPEIRNPTRNLEPMEAVSSSILQRNGLVIGTGLPRNGRAQPQASQSGLNVDSHGSYGYPRVQEKS